MLVLTRQVSQAFVLGQDITIRVVSVKGNNVRLGIDAPEHITIVREELTKRVAREKASLDAAENDAGSA